MAVSDQWISELDENTPDGATERVNVLDDHIRAIKRVLVNTFANFTGEEVEASEDDLSTLAGAAAAGGVQFVDAKGQNDGYASLDSGGQVPIAQLPFGDAGFPTATRMLFQQASAPTGWTKVTDAFYNNKALRLTTGTTMNGGDLDFNDVFKSHNTGGPSQTASVTDDGTTQVNVASSAHTHVLDLDVAFIGVIIATKDA